MIIYVLLLTTFEVSSNFWGSWFCSGKWFEPKTKPPQPSLNWPNLCNGPQWSHNCRPSFCKPKIYNKSSHKQDLAFKYNKLQKHFGLRRRSWNTLNVDSSFVVGYELNDTKQKYFFLVWKNWRTCFSSGVNFTKLCSKGKKLPANRVWRKIHCSISPTKFKPNLWAKICQTLFVIPSICAPKIF